MRGVKTFHPRYLMSVLPVFLALLAAGASGPGRWPRAAAVVALLLVGVSLGQHYFHPAYGKEDSRSAARVILERERPGDAVVVIYSFRPFRHYFADTGPDLDQENWRTAGLTGSSEFATFESGVSD